MFWKKYLFVLTGLCLFGFSHSFDLKPFTQFYFPADVTVSKDSMDVSSEQDWEADFVIEAGVEALFSAEFSPMRYGFGMGFRSAQQSDGTDATPPSIPLWVVLSFGRIQRESIFSPYLSLRGGYLTPVSTDANWWERPINYFANCGIGVVFPLGITLETSVDYSSMQKSFVDDDVKFRVSSFRIGIMLAMNIEVSRDKVYKQTSE
ncbi:MAG: hypothetical protein J6U20_01560 [Fibrobacter sp.]|nr:hypothetical protein [Fibrobacter sp.]